MKGERQRRDMSEPGDTGDTTRCRASTKQGQAGGPILTRRELLAAGAAATATVALTACAPGVVQKPAATATPFALKRPAVLYADGTVPGRRHLHRRESWRPRGHRRDTSRDQRSHAARPDFDLWYAAARV